MSPNAFFQPLWLSLQLATITTVILMMVATPIAWWLAQSSSRWRPLVQTVVAYYEATCLALWRQPENVEFRIPNVKGWSHRRQACPTHLEIVESEVRTEAPS